MNEKVNVLTRQADLYLSKYNLQDARDEIVPLLRKVNSFLRSMPTEGERAACIQLDALDNLQDLCLKVGYWDNAINERKTYWRDTTYIHAVGDVMRIVGELVINGKPYEI